MYKIMYKTLFEEEEKTTLSYSVLLGMLNFFETWRADFPK